MLQAKAGERTVGSIVCKAERELDDDPLTGYIAMLAVDTTFRKHGIGELPQTASPFVVHIFYLHFVLSLPGEIRVVFPFSPFEKKRPNVLFSGGCHLNRKPQSSTLIQRFRTFCSQNVNQLKIASRGQRRDAILSGIE